jgi:hypothetical protein
MDNEWSRDTQKYAVLSWITFLVAAVFTMIFFAFIDPLLVVDALGLELVDSRNAGYAIGFFFLWINSWVAGWLTLRLVRRKRTGPNSIAKNS